MNKDYKITVTFQKYDGDPIETAFIAVSSSTEENALYEAMNILHIKNMEGVISVLTEEIEAKIPVIREIT